MKETRRRAVCLILALIVSAGAISGCGSSGADTAPAAGTPAADAVEKAEAVSNSDVQDAGSETAVPETTAAEYVIADEVIVENEDCLFKITKAEEDGFWGFTLKVLCENKTADKTLMFSWDDVSVNGYMVDPFWATEVAAGKKANSEISFSSSSFDEIGVSTADEIVFTLSVHDSDDWMADYLVEETFAIYPTGLSADTVAYPERKTVAGEQVLIDNEKVTFVILQPDEDGFWGYTVKCYLENKTDQRLMFSWEDVSVNGFMADPYWATSVAPGRRAYSEIDFMDSTLEENDITDIEEIEFSLHIYDYDDWFSGNVVEEVFTYRP